MIGHHARFRENDDLPLWQGPATKKKPPFCSARALKSRVKLCAVGMRIAILGNKLKGERNEPIMPVNRVVHLFTDLLQSTTR